LNWAAGYLPYSRAAAGHDQDWPRRQPQGCRFPSTDTLEHQVTLAPVRLDPLWAGRRGETAGVDRQATHPAGGGPSDQP